MAADLQRFLVRARSGIEATREQEHVGEAADGLVVATLRGTESTISLHVTAKRRLDREELGEAIVEAVGAAERAAHEATLSAMRTSMTGLSHRHEIADQLDQALERSESS